MKKNLSLNNHLKEQDELLQEHRDETKRSEKSAKS